MQLQLVNAFGHGRTRTWQKAGAHPIGDITEPQIEARRLNLAFDEGIGGQNKAGIRHGSDHAVGQNAMGVGLKRERHGRSPRDDLVIAVQTLKIRTFIGYPMAALTERARGNISITYPVVI